MEKTWKILPGQSQFGTKIADRQTDRHATVREPLNEKMLIRYGQCLYGGPLFSRVMDTVIHFFKIGYNGPIIPIYGAILAIHGAILAI